VHKAREREGRVDRRNRRKTAYEHRREMHRQSFVAAKAKVESIVYLSGGDAGVL
jgi:hypothetical protein